MKLVKNLILLAVLAVLAGYVYFYEIVGGEERDAAKKETEKVFHFNADSVARVEINNYNNVFEFEREGEDWKIVKPLETRGDKSTIRSMLTSLQNAKKDRSFKTTSADLANYELSGRPLKVTVTLNNGTIDSLRFGGETPVGSNMFVSKQDTAVYTIPAYLKSSVNKKLFDWRDKSVSTIKTTDVKSFDLKNSHGSFSLEKQGANWQLTAPKKVRADNGVISSLLGKLENGRVKSVVSESMDSPRVFGLDRPAVKIDLAIGESKAHKSLIFSQLKENSANGKNDSRPYVFTVDSLFMRDLDVSLTKLRYKKFSEFTKSLADSISLTQGDSTVTFHKDSSQVWTTLFGDSVNQAKINSFINTVSTLTAKKFLADNVHSSRNYGLAHPIRRIEIFGKDQKLADVRFADKRGLNRVAFSAVSGQIVEIEDLVYSRTELKPADYIVQKDKN